ncbi:MAG: hypothetical protein RBG13Loki_2322 [Promethearchaeota archaeon CR_4]|nr:MAG: hypothetical protein RBG13Loki_2322 [Candidatus Lokiarchaeota archaeon CR_4]
MILQFDVQTVIVVIFYIFLVSLAVYVAGSLFKKETSKQGYGTALILSLIFILVLYFVIRPFLFEPFINIAWVEIIIIFLFMLVLFAIFYDIGIGYAFLAAIICAVVLWLIELLMIWVFGLFSVTFDTIIYI